MIETGTCLQTWVRMLLSGYMDLISLIFLTESQRWLRPGPRLKNQPVRWRADVSRDLLKSGEEKNSASQENRCFSVLELSLFSPIRTRHQNTTQRHNPSSHLFSIVVGQVCEVYSSGARQYVHPNLDVYCTFHYRPQTHNMTPPYSSSTALSQCSHKTDHMWCR